MLKTLLSVALLSASTALLAQGTPPADAGKGQKMERRFDCSKAKDPTACEERRAKVKAAHEKALKACEGKSGDERRGCMSHEMCSQTKDPAKCEARMKERAERRHNKK